MKTLIIIALFVAGFILGIRLYQLWRSAKQLRIERSTLLGVVEWDRKERAKYLTGALKIELTLPERRIILDALNSPQYKERVATPKTKRFIRIIYGELRTKIKEAIISLSDEGILS